MNVRWLWTRALPAVLAGAGSPAAAPPPAPEGDIAAGTVTEEVVMDDGAALPLSAWLPPQRPRRVVLALHGFNDSRLAFDDLAARLYRDAVAVYAYDQRGFGATAGRGHWPGTERLIADAAAMAGRVRARHPGVPFSLLGESMGGALVIELLGRGRVPEPDSAVLLAPAVWARAVQPWYTRAALWLGIRLLPGLTVSRRWVGVQPSDDPAVLHYWDTHPLVIRKTRVDALYGVTGLMDRALADAGRLRGRVLILYGGRDQVMPPAATCALLERLPNPAPARLAYYPEGYHLLSRGSGAAPVREDIAAWLRSPDTPLPSGSDRHIAEAVDLLCD